MIRFGLGIWIGAVAGAAVSYASAYAYGWLKGYGTGQAQERANWEESRRYRQDLMTEDHERWRRKPETHGEIGHICPPGCTGKEDI